MKNLCPISRRCSLRFPIPAALSVLLCAYVNFVSIGSSWNDDGDVIAGAAAAFIAAGAAHLFSEGRGLSRVTSILLAFAAAVLAGALGYFTEVFDSNLLFLFAGLIPVLMIAPYLRDNAKQGALWLFNLHFGLAVLLSIVVAVLFAAGLSAIVESLNFLFNANLHGNLHEHIWSTAASLVAPIYGLSLMPKDLDEEVDIASQKGTLLERGVSVLVNYVLVPVILIYAVILHAYAVKIACRTKPSRKARSPPSSPSLPWAAPAPGSSPGPGGRRAHACCAGSSAAGSGSPSCPPSCSPSPSGGAFPIMA